MENKQPKPLNGNNLVHKKLRTQNGFRKRLVRPDEDFVAKEESEESE